MLPLKLRALTFVDRHAGPALLAAVARIYGLEGYPRLIEEGGEPWGNEPVDPAAVGRILVIRPGGIGDAVLSFPMLSALRAHFGGVPIDMLAERRNAGIWAANDIVDRVLLYDRLGGFPLGRALRSRYDLVVDTEQYHRLSSLMAFFTRARYRCGFDTLGRGRFFTHRVRYREMQYEVYSFLNLAEALTGKKTVFDPGRSFLPVAPGWLTWADETLRRAAGAPVVIIVPATGTPTRVWPTERYRRVAEWLIGRDFAVCLLGGADCVRAAAAIARGLDPARIFNLTAATSLAQACGLMRRAALYLGADCGLLHVAVALGTPTVHMFGSGIQEKWAPAGANYFLIDKRLPCSPCTRYGYTPPCPYGVACMRAIGADEVIETVARATGSSNPPPGKDRP